LLNRFGKFGRRESFVPAGLRRLDRVGKVAARPYMNGRYIDMMPFSDDFGQKKISA